MDKFEEYIKARYPVDYEHLKEKYPNVPVGEFYGDEKDLWNYRQAEVDEYKMVSESIEDMYLLVRKRIEEKDKRIKELESRLNAVMALSKMRAAVVKAENWSKLRPHIKNAIKCLDRKEKALRGEHES